LARFDGGVERGAGRFGADQSALGLEPDLIHELLVTNLPLAKLHFIARHIGLCDSVAERQCELESDGVSGIAARENLG
jgi:hypothetical protein